MFQRDLGSSLLFFGLFLVMLYVATERPGWLVVGGAMFLAGAYSAYLLFSHVPSASTPGCTRSTRTTTPTSWCRASTAWRGAG